MASYKVILKCFFLIENKYSCIFKDSFIYLHIILQVYNKIMYLQITREYFNVYNVGFFCFFFKYI